MEIRLNKFLAERLGLSRREADEAISHGKVTIDGKPAQLGARVDKNSKVCYNNNTVPFDNEFLYVAFNKPVGYVCSRRAQGNAPTLYELLPKKYQTLKTVGRLDKDSSGLILLTNDGDFAFQMTHPKFRKTKVYEVELNKPLEPLHQQMISDYGVLLDDGPSKFKVIKNPARVLSEPISSDAGLDFSSTSYAGAPREPSLRDEPLGHVRNIRVEKSNLKMHPNKQVSATRAAYIVTLSEGRNRQIRRTFSALGYRVTKLHRVTFGKYELANLKPGEYEEFKIN